MKQSVWAAVALAVAFATPAAMAQVTSTASGGAGGQGGQAAGGTATGGAATNTTSGVSTATGQGGTGGNSEGGSGGLASSTGGTASASGGSVGSVSTGGSNAQLGDITVNYNLPSSPAGKAGLGVGVDPNTGHVVTDNTVTYQGSYKLKNTPDVSVGGPASGPCNGFSGGIGVSVPGFSVGANASTVDEGCSARETARVAAMIGRMDVANAILDNLPIVQAAMKAKAARESLALPPKTSETPATAAPANWHPAPPQEQKEAALKEQQRVAQEQKVAQEQREAALREQQRLAQEALTRQATMAKVNDTLKFTDATNQGDEKTPQQLMAEEATKKMLANSTTQPASNNVQQASNNAVPSPSPQSGNRQDTQATTAPLAPPPAIRAEMIVPVSDRRMAPSAQVTNAPGALQTARAEPTKGVENKASSVPGTTEERVRAARAALNLQ